MAAFTPGTNLEFQILNIYLENQLLRVFNSNTVATNVALTCIEGSNALDEARRDAGDWFLGPGRMDYCINTLALRVNGRIVELVPSTAGQVHDWVPLNRQSWPVWYHLLDQEIGLNRLFLGEGGK